MKGLFSRSVVGFVCVWSAADGGGDRGGAVFCEECEG